MTEIGKYPIFTEPALEARQSLHQVFISARKGISEFTFANIYLFRNTHNYRVSFLEGNLVVSGNDSGNTFFMLPGAFPEGAVLKELFGRFSFMKCVTEEEKEIFLNLGYRVEEDRENFDYLYEREEMTSLAGRRFHRKKNLVNFFTGAYTYEGRPLIDEYIKDALFVLDEWRKAQSRPGDYEAAKEALVNCDELQLCGGIYFVEGKPAAYALGEELKDDTFVVHFEKGIGDFKGLLQFVNQSFASILPQKYRFINREQDLGDEGLRKSKISYRPAGFVKKYRAHP